MFSSAVSTVSVVIVAVVIVAVGVSCFAKGCEMI